MINATTARQLVQNAKKSNSKEQFEVLAKIIDQAIHDEQYSTVYDGTIFPENVAALKNLGYGVGEASTFKNETTTTISW